MKQSLPKILCVDDERELLTWLVTELSHRFEVETALTGEDGLRVLQERGPFAVVISDHKMLHMSGELFLERARAICPDTVRVLLTNQLQLEGALAAIHNDQIFRFLPRPCPDEELLCAVEGAARQYELITAERELLEQTLRGCVKTLIDVLAIANHAAFGRALRIQSHAMAIAEAIELRDHWVLDVAAMLSMLGWVSLPHELVEKLGEHAPLTKEEASQIEGAKAFAEKLLVNIPRVEKIRWILANYEKKRILLEPSSHQVTCAKILKIASDYEELEALHVQPELAINTMRSRGGLYDKTLLDVLAAHLGQLQTDEVRELPLRKLCVGMKLAKEIRTHSGMLLVAKGYEITPTFMERLSNYPAGTIVEPIFVKVRSDAPKIRECFEPRDVMHR